MQNQENHDTGNASQSNSESEQCDEIKSENNFLKQYVSRLTNELQCYQDHTNLTNEKISCAVKLPEWMTSSNVMSPIFLAYDFRIRELSSIIQDQEKQLNDIIVKTDTVETESEKRNLNMTEGISIFQDDKNKTKDKKYEDNEYEKLKSQLRIMKEENFLLSEQASILTSELDYAQKHILSQDKQIAILSQELTKKTETSQKLQDQLSALMADKVNCEEELFAKVKDLIKEQDSLKKMESNMQSVNNLRSDLTAKIEELSMEKEELEIEVEQLTTKVTSSTNSIHELQDKLCKKNVAYDLQHAHFKRLEQEHKMTCNELKLLINVANRMEKQVEELKSNEKQMKNQVDESNIKMEDELIYRGKLETERTSLRSETESISEKMKHKTDKLLEDHEKIIVKMKNYHSHESSSKDQEINDLLAQANKLRYKGEQKTREKESMEQKYQNFVDVNETRKQDFKQKLEDMSLRVVEAETGLENEVKKRRQFELSYKSMEQQIEELKKCIESYQADLSTEQSRYEHSLKDLKENVRSAENENSTLKLEVSTLINRVEEEKCRAEKKLDIQLQQKMIEMEELKIEMKRLSMKFMDYEKNMDEKIKCIEREKEDEENRKCTKISVLETILKDEKELCQRLITRNKDLDEKYQVLIEEKLHLCNFKYEAGFKIEELHKELNTTKERLNMVVTKFNECVEELKERIRDERVLKCEVRKTRMEIDQIKLKERYI